MSKDQKPIPKSPQDAVNTLGIRVYKEQCSGGFENVLRRVIKLPNDTYKAYAIIHDKVGKAHLHIGISRKNGDLFRVSSMLKQLGIVFRDEDKMIMINRGLETLGNFNTFLRYLTHTDEDSKKAGKKQYDLSEFVTNMDRAVFTSLLGSNIKIRKLTKSERLQHDCRDAEMAGYNLWNYSHWIETKKYDFIDYSKNNLTKINEFFRDGQIKRFSETRPQIVIYIDIPKELGIPLESFSKIIYNSLNDIHIYENAITLTNNETYYQADNNVGLGRVIVLNSLNETYKNIDNTTPNRIITMMMNLEDHIKYYSYPYYIKQGGMTYTIVISDDNRWYNTLMSIPNKSFFCSTINTETKELVFKAADERGSDNLKQTRHDLYLQFRDAFNLRLMSYTEDDTNSEQGVDYSDL